MTNPARTVSRIAMPKGGLCVRGNGIWLSHDWDVRTAVCTRCGAEMPKPEVRNGR